MPHAIFLTHPHCKFPPMCLFNVRVLHPLHRTHPTSSRKGATCHLLCLYVSDAAINDVNLCAIYTSCEHTHVILAPFSTQTCDVTIEQAMLQVFVRPRVTCVVGDRLTPLHALSSFVRLQCRPFPHAIQTGLSPAPASWQVTRSWGRCRSRWPCCRQQTHSRPRRRWPVPFPAPGASARQPRCPRC